MKKIILFFAVGLVLVLPSCSSITVSYDYDKTANFNAYKTYAYTPEALSLAVGDLNRDRIIAAIDFLPGAF